MIAISQDRGGTRTLEVLWPCDFWIDLNILELQTWGDETQQHMYLRAGACVASIRI